MVTGRWLNTLNSVFLFFFIVSITFVFNLLKFSELIPPLTANSISTEYNLRIPEINFSNFLITIILKIKTSLLIAGMFFVGLYYLLNSLSDSISAFGAHLPTLAIPFLQDALLA